MQCTSSETRAQCESTSEKQQAPRSVASITIGLRLPERVASQKKGIINEKRGEVERKKKHVFYDPVVEIGEIYASRSLAAGRLENLGVTWPWGWAVDVGFANVRGSLGVADRPILGVRSGVLYILGNGGGAFLTLQLSNRTISTNHNRTEHRVVGPYS